MNLYHKEYLQYPDVPPIGIFYDPGEQDEPTPPEEEDDAMRYIKKHNRLAKKGVISPAKVMEAIKRWDTLPPEEKMAWRKGHKKRK